MIRYTLPAILLVTAGCDSMIDFRDRIVGSGDDVVPAAMEPAPMAQATAKERFVTAAEGQGCVVSADTIAAIMTDATISQSELGAIVTELEAEGRAVVEGDAAVRIVSDGCPTA